MNKLFIGLCICFSSIICACSSGGDGEGDSGSLQISADKSTIVADGEEVVTFTVKDKDGRNVTSECIILKGTVELTSNTFSTTVAGEYEFSAKKVTGEISDKIKVVAIENNAQLTIKADKTNLVADGGDIVALRLVDANDVDLTSEAEFYLDGVSLRRGAARTKTIGSHKVTAKWKGKACEGTLTLTGVSAPNDFTGRLLVEYSTSTSCMYCPTYIQAFKQCLSNSRFALVSVHREPSSIYSEYYEQSTKNRVQEFVDYYGGYVPYPGALFNRGTNPISVSDKSKVLESIPAKSDVGIAVDAYFDGLKFRASVAVHSKTNFTGKIGAILVEDGIRAYQTQLGEVEMEKILRDYQPSVAGENITLTNGTPASKEFSFEKSGVKNTNKCEIIVFVLGEDQLLKNVQRVAVGKVIGY